MQIEGVMVMERAAVFRGVSPSSRSRRKSVVAMDFESGGISISVAHMGFVVRTDKEGAITLQITFIADVT